MDYDYEKERREAIWAGERARNSLIDALNALDSARGWGIFDILGGEIITTLFKHSRMDEASEYIDYARQDLMAFSRQLGDLHEYANVNLSTWDFWGIADWLFDGLLPDIVMQERINEARWQLEEAVRRVDDILLRLRNGY